MYNWNVSIETWKKKDEKFIVWKLNQLINFGLNGEKLSFRLVKKYWDQLRVDPKRKRFLQFLIWQKQS